MPRTFRKYACLVLAGLLSVGTPVVASEPAEIRTSDVALNEGGLLKGTVLSTTAQPLAGIKINVMHENKLVATSTTNEKGEFTVKALRNGSHVIQVGTNRQSVRLWSTNSAPPASVENIAIVVDEETVRGQLGLPVADPGSYVAENAGKLLLIGGAVAVTLATTLNHDSDNATPASP